MDCKPNHGLVLVVDDEPIIRMCAASMIEDAGFSTIEASNADDAMLLLRGRDDIAFLFTDVCMPGSIDGLKLAHQVHDQWPQIRIVVTSGHMLARDHGLPEGSRFLPKPYAAQIVPYLFWESTAH